MKNFTKKQKIIALSATLFISGILFYLIPTKQNTNIPSINIQQIPNVTVTGKVEVIPGCIKSDTNDCSEVKKSESITEEQTSLTKEDIDNPNIKKPIEPKIIKDSNGIEYDSNQYKEAPKEGVEPKWNFSEIIVDPIKYGSSTVTYYKCQSCHGANGMQPAFKKTKPIFEMTKEEIINSLESYKTGNLDRYGFGKVMNESTKKMSTNGLICLANQIKSLDQGNNRIED